MHHRDLARGPAETQQGDPQPDPERFTEADAVAGFARHRLRLVLLMVASIYGFALLVGQLWVSPVASRHQR